MRSYFTGFSFSAFWLFPFPLPPICVQLRRELKTSRTFKKILNGSHGGSVSPDIEIPRLIRLVHQGKMRLDGLVTHTFPLEQVNEAIAALRSGEAARVMLRMGEE